MILMTDIGVMSMLGLNTRWYVHVKTGTLEHNSALSFPQGGPVPISAGSSSTGALPGGASGLSM